tara:strand:- start:2369 stop:2659 length:291 start_codon:yes stop_codon:yes gene_type:complete
MSTSDPITQMFQAARNHRPFGKPGDFGFETRLRASLKQVSPSLADWVSHLSWRFSLVCVPVLVAGALFASLQTQGFLPEGIGGFVAQWTELIPFTL